VWLGLRLFALRIARVRPLSTHCEPLSIRPPAIVGDSIIDVISVKKALAHLPMLLFR
jgi:hypothetical protein